MERRAHVLFLVAAITAVSSGAPGHAAVMSAEGPRGRIITVRTGTDGGACRLEGAQIVCRDGDRSAVASLESGCTEVSGGAHCDVGPIGLAGGVVTPANSNVDVECESGSKKGYIYNLVDGDGQGTCAQTYDIGNRVNGGRCQKGRNECATVDCDHGCHQASMNCECHIKSRPRASATTTGGD